MLAFSGFSSTGWFGIPLAPNYFTDKEIDDFNLMITIFSFLGIIWGIMAYREFTRSKNHVIEARILCKKLDPDIGNYVYQSFNPLTKKYENGYVPLGPLHFWDPETTTPSWLDKGKYWHIFLGLQSRNKNILLTVVSDDELKLFSEKQNVATTSKKLISSEELISKKENLLTRKKNYQFIVCIPQWLVLDTDFSKFSPIKSSLDIIDDSELVTLINSINNQLINATGEIIEQERQHIKYPWKIGTFLILLNKSLPIRIVYNEILYKLRKDIPGQKKSFVNEANLNLAYLTNKELIDAIILLTSMRDISKESINKIDTLLKFLDNAYKKQGLGDGSNKYHNLHHSLEVAFVGLQLLPKKLFEYEFSNKDFEILTVASLLHDYDPLQRYDNKLSIGLGRAEGPKVERTIQELSRNKIHEAYFLLNASEFMNYFDDYYSYSLPPLKYNTTHPEYLKYKRDEDGKDNGKPKESIIVEAMILRTDYPFYLKIDSQNKFKENLRYLDSSGLDAKRYEILAEVLWLADLSVAYMGSDPLNAWNRVINLYDELYLPKSSIITQTDLFFSQFIENELFKVLITNKSLPDIFKQRWNVVSKFYQEGNPSTIINRTIERFKKSYSSFNLGVGIKSWSVLYNMGITHPNEYFISIGADFDSVYEIKNRLAVLNARNISCYWGKLEKLLPNIKNQTIMNLFYTIEIKDKNYQVNTEEISNIFRYAKNILEENGTIQILINSSVLFTNTERSAEIDNTSKKNTIVKEIIRISELFNFKQVKENDEDFSFNLNGQEYFQDNNKDKNYLLKFAANR